MENFYKNYDTEFFVIDSDNLNNTKQRLYGFSSYNNEIIQDKQVTEEMEFSGFGAYVFIKNENNKIIISQDFNGCYGLYIFKKNDYFAISNSFIKLVDYLKYNYELSFNKDYADAFLYINLASFSYCDTMINEIKVLPRNYIVIINKLTKKIEFKEIDYHEKTIPLDSKEGLEVLDSWYEKWVGIIRSIKSETNNITIDLSGGFDSRVIAALWITANIDFDKIRINSIHDKLHTHKEDYEIASKIAEFFNFKLNKNPHNSNHYKFTDIRTPINNSFNIKLGFHKQMYFKTFRFEEPRFSLTGAGGGSMRGYPNQTKETYLQATESIIKKENPSLVNSALKIANKSFDKIIEKFNIDEKSIELTEIHYKETRGRNHFGKVSVESYFSNIFTLTPLIDQDLRKLKLNSQKCNDNYLLMALIFLRYCPELFNFEFDGNREIRKDTIKYAEKLNNKYPYTKKHQTFISGPPIKKHSVTNKKINSKKSIKRDDIDGFLKKVFCSKRFEREFEKYYSMKDYYSIINGIKTKNYFPLADVYSAIAIIKIANAVEFSKTRNFTDEYGWLKNFIDNEPRNLSKHHLYKYCTSRIDIKNKGEKNSIEILEKTDMNANIKFPKWFEDKSGKGCVILSSLGSIKLKIKCVNDGNLEIKLRGQDIRDIEGNRFPVYIDYTEFKVNDKDVISKNKLTCHDDFYRYEKNVKNSEIIDLEIKWMPFNENSCYKKNKKK